MFYVLVASCLPMLEVLIASETNYTENNSNVKIQNAHLNFNVSDQKP